MIDSLKIHYGGDFSGMQTKGLAILDFLNALSLASFSRFLAEQNGEAGTWQGWPDQTVEIAQTA